MRRIRASFLGLGIALLLTTSAFAVTGSSSIQSGTANEHTQDCMDYTITVDSGMGGIDDGRHWSIDVDSILSKVSVVAAVAASGGIVLLIYRKKRR